MVASSHLLHNPLVKLSYRGIGIFREAFDVSNERSGGFLPLE